MLKYIYLFLSIIGAIVPYYFLVSFFIQEGFNWGLIVQQMFYTYINSLFTYDLGITAIVLTIYILTNRVKHFWTALIGTWLISVSFALPWFLYLKELDKTSKTQ